MLCCLLCTGKPVHKKSCLYKTLEEVTRYRTRPSYCLIPCSNCWVYLERIAQLEDAPRTALMCFAPASACVYQSCQWLHKNARQSKSRSWRYSADNDNLLPAIPAWVKLLRPRFLWRCKEQLSWKLPSSSHGGCSMKEKSEIRLKYHTA